MIAVAQMSVNSFYLYFYYCYLQLQVAKGQSAPVVSSQPSGNKPTTPDWQHGPETTNQPSAASSNPIDRSGTEMLEDTIAMDDEGDSILRFLYLIIKPANGGVK